ncbi:MAG: hypothetical protein MR809_00475 [Rikenellaceae bacterium]|nr:hypothetical protein [Rikenellaceae bacterium]
MYNILLLGSGTQSLAIIPSLFRAGYRIIIISSTDSNYGDKSRYVYKHYATNCPFDHRLVSFALEIIKCDKIDAVIPMGDTAAEFLSKYKQEICSRVKFTIPDYDIFIKGYDKNQLMSLCDRRGYPHPQTIDLSVFDISNDAVRNFPFPAMLKPNCTTGGRGMVEVQTYEEFLSIYPELHKQFGDYHLQRFVKAGGRQIKVQLYVDEYQQLVAHSEQQKMRWYPNKAGSNCCAISIVNNELVTICHNVLKDLKWVGFADFDIIEDPNTGELLIMEINPRLPACIKGSVMAGINWGEILVNGALGLPQKTYGYKEGVILRHLGLEVLWFIHASNRWHTNPCWFRFFGKNIFYQDMNGLSDPMPFVSGTFSNIRKLFNPEFRQMKQGV